MTTPALDIRIERGCADDEEIAAVIAALATVLGARRAQEQPVETMRRREPTWLRERVLVPPAAWNAGPIAA